MTLRVRRTDGFRNNFPRNGRSRSNGEHNEPKVAARMLGHVDAWVATSQYDLAPNEARAADEAGREIDAAIGAAEHARLRKEGSALTDAEADAIAFALIAKPAPVLANRPA